MNISYDNIDVTYKWANGESFGHVRQGTNTYEGNFVKNMLKINNIAHDIACLFKIHGDMSILPQLEKIDGLIIRDIVSINSLYI